MPLNTGGDVIRMRLAILFIVITWLAVASFGSATGFAVVLPDHANSGLGASSQSLRPYGWARSLTSIGSFNLGSFVFAQLHCFLGTRRRASLVLSFLVQAYLILIKAGLVEAGAISSFLDGRPSQVIPPWDQEVPIVLLSLQFAGQIVASRSLRFNEIPTVVITSLLCDLMSDPKLFLLSNHKRDRRIIAFVLTLAGAIIGGWVTKLLGQSLPFGYSLIRPRLGKVFHEG